MSVSRELAAVLVVALLCGPALRGDEPALRQRLSPAPGERAVAGSGPSLPAARTLTPAERLVGLKAVPGNPACGRAGWCPDDYCGKDCPLIRLPSRCPDGGCYAAKCPPRVSRPRVCGLSGCYAPKCPPVLCGCGTHGQGGRAGLAGPGGRRVGHLEKDRVEHRQNDHGEQRGGDKSGDNRHRHGNKEGVH